VAQYPVSLGTPKRPAEEAIVTICPFPVEIMAGRNAFVVYI